MSAQTGPVVAVVGPRPAVTGEVCTCGRRAVLVYPGPDGGEVGYCGLPDGGAKDEPCPFCGQPRHGRVCPAYTVMAPEGFTWSR